MLGAAKPWRLSERIAAEPNIAAGVPWKSEIRQLENSGRILRVCLRKIRKYPIKYMERNIKKNAKMAQLSNDANEVVGAVLVIFLFFSGFLGEILGFYSDAAGLRLRLK